MIELRIVENELGVKPDIQYRYKLPESEQWFDSKNNLVEWSFWETAEWVKAEEIEND
jgi:hypothetical protein